MVPGFGIITNIARNGRLATAFHAACLTESPSVRALANSNNRAAGW